FHLHGHNGLEYDGQSLAAGILEAENACHPKCLLGRVHVVIRTIRKMHFDINDRKASQHATVQGLHYTFPHGGNELARYHAAFDFIEKLKALATLVWLDREHDMTILPLAT